MSPSKAPCNILLGIDGSEHSFAAAAMLADLPLPPECQITALGIFLPREASFHSRLLAPLQKVKQDLEERGFHVTTDTVAGSPAEVLTEYAEANAVDLIVLGAKGRRATLGIFLGGVAQQILEYSNRPVLVVRAPYTGLKHALLATDGSPYSEMAVAYLGRFPLPEGTKLTVLHVLPPLPAELPPGVAAMSPRHNGTLLFETLLAAESPETEAEEEQKGQQLVARTLEQIRRFTAERGASLPLSGQVRRGDAATEIIQYARDHQVDLVIAGSRGLSQVQGWLLGSVSRKLVHYAPCSALIVRGQG